MNGALRDELLGQGAAVVGYAALTGLLGAEIAHLDRAVSIGVARRLNEDTLGILTRLQKRAVRQLKAQGFRTLALPPDSDRKKDTFVSKLYALFNHKMAATSAGIGWVGMNGLLISPQHGPRLSLATVLTDAPLAADAAVRDEPLRGVHALPRPLPLAGDHRRGVVARQPLRRTGAPRRVPRAQGGRAPGRGQAQLRPLHHRLPLRAKNGSLTKGDKQSGGRKKVQVQGARNPGE